MRYMVVDEKGARVETVEDGTDFLSVAQKAVGGLIESFFTINNPNAVTPKHKLTGYCNEEGLYLFTEDDFHARTSCPDERIRGPIVICGVDMENGGTLSLTDEDIAWLLQRMTVSVKLHFL